MVKNVRKQETRFSLLIPDDLIVYDYYYSNFIKASKQIFVCGFPVEFKISLNNFCWY